VVDDECHIDLIKRGLYSGGLQFNLLVCNGIAAAIDVIVSSEIDIVLSETWFENNTVMSLVKYCKNRNVPIVLMTSLENENIAIEAMNNGAIDYVVKSPEVFIRMHKFIARALRGWKSFVEKKYSERALRESEERYRRLLSSITGYVYTVKILNGVVNSTNYSVGCENLTGYTPIDFTVDSNLWLTMVHQDDRQLVSDVTAKILTSSESISFENRIIHKSGTLLWISTTLVPHLDASGFLTSYDGIVNNITERKLSEEKLCQSENKFRTIFENIQDVYFEIAIDGTILEISPSIEKMSSCPREELIGESFYSHYLFIGEKETFYNILVEQGRVTDFEIVLQNKKGELLICSIVAELQKDISGKPLKIYGTMRDITNRKNVESALRESETKFRQFAETVNEGFWIFDVSANRFTYVNKAMQNISGHCEYMFYNDPDLIKKVIHKDDLEYVNSERVNGETGILEFRIIRNDGQLRWIRSRRFPLINNDGTTLQLFGISEDITNYKIAVDQAKLHQQQLIQADKMKSLGVLVSGVAHEINNPNNLIMFNADLANQIANDFKPILDQYKETHPKFNIAGASFEETQKQLFNLLAGISNGSRRIRDIVANLKDFVRIDKENAFQKLQINSIVKSSITIVGNLIRKSTEFFSVSYDPEIPEIQGNTQQIEQVIINLLTNACQALQDRKRKISVNTSFVKNEKQVCVTIIDEGCGIAPENLKQIMDPFYTTKRDSGGTGLGLSISFSIVEAHKGKLLFSSELNKGTTAQLQLPVSRN
jgi:PAS domain S-box-containing protein